MGGEEVGGKGVEVDGGMGGEEVGGRGVGVVGGMGGEEVGSEGSRCGWLEGSRSG